MRAIRDAAQQPLDIDLTPLPMGRVSRDRIIFVRHTRRRRPHTHAWFVDADGAVRIACNRDGIIDLRGRS